MATTTNFGWETPDDTDLVKDGAAAIRTALGGVDTSFVDLKGGTTGQLLAKASNTDLDYTWVAPTTGDITGVSVTSPITGGGTSGDVTIGISSSAIVPSQTGNAGKYLTTDGTTSSWGTISAGGYTQLASGSLTGSVVSLTSISQSYKSLRLVLRACSISGNDQMTLQINTRNSGYSFSTIDSLNGLQSTGSGGASIYKLTTANQTGLATDQSFVIDFPDYANTNSSTIFNHVGVYTQSPTNTTQSCSGSGANDQVAAINSIQIKANYGGSFTWDNGTYILYGVN